MLTPERVARAVAAAREAARLDRMSRRITGRPDAAKSPMFIYILITDNGLTKIGMSKNVNERVIALNVASPIDIEFHEAVQVPRELARLIEKLCHEALRELHVKGEWFRVSKTEAASVVWSVIASVKSTLQEHQEIVYGVDGAKLATGIAENSCRTDNIQEANKRTALTLLHEKWKAREKASRF